MSKSQQDFSQSNFSQSNFSQPNFSGVQSDANDWQEEVILQEDEHTEYFQGVDKIAAHQPAALKYRTILNALALAGFQEWMAERAGEFALDLRDCSLLQPDLAGMIDAVCNLHVGHLRVGLIAVEAQTACEEQLEDVPFPRVAISLPEFMADFYGLVVVEWLNQEPQEREVRVVIQGFLRADQLNEHQSCDALLLQPDWHDLMPVSWFEEQPTLFLSYLRGKTRAIVSPSSPQDALITLCQRRDELEEILSRYFEHEPGTHVPALWEVLPWELGRVVLTCPELRDWWHSLSSADATARSRQGLRATLDSLTRQIFNTWNWLNHQADDFSQRWQWLLQPSLIPAFRNEPAAYPQIHASLRAKGIHLPTQAGNACIDFEFADYSLRLRAIPIPATGSHTDRPTEWRLVIILEAQPNHVLPTGIRLQVSDATDLLDEQCFAQSQNGYLYSSVVGGCEEHFFVTIQLGNWPALIFPPFGYIMNEV